MALLEADFEKAIQGFVSAWRVASIELDETERGEVHREQSDWDNVQVAEKVCCGSFGQRVSSCVCDQHD
jgi:hypothetical protein